MSLDRSLADMAQLDTLRQVRNFYAIVQIGEDMVGRIKQGETSAIPCLKARLV